MTDRSNARGVSGMGVAVKFETVRDVAHVWVGRETLEDGGYQYVKRWKNQGMPWAEYWPVREHSLLVRLGEGDIRHVVEVIGIDARRNEVRTRDAGISLDRLDRHVEVKGEEAAHPHPFFDIAELLKLMRWALVALEEVHRVGLVHCDLSAGNICLPLASTRDGWYHLDYSRLKLIDFAFSLHRALPLKYPLPMDTTSPELFYLPPFFRAAIAQDQRESQPVHGQRVMTPGIDLYSLGMITQGWYRAGIRPHDRISAASVEELFHRLGSHGRDGSWREVLRCRATQLIREIDGMLDRADTDIERSPDFRFLDAGARPMLARTAVTPLLTRIRQPQPPPEAELAQERVQGATMLTVRRPADAVTSVAFASDDIVPGSAAIRPWGTGLLPGLRSGAGEGGRGGRGRMYGALLLLCSTVGAAWHWGRPGPDAPPAGEARVSAPVTPARQVRDPALLANALASPDARRRAESAQALARIAREGGEGAAFADGIARRYIDMLNTGALRPDARELHATAWAALTSLSAQPDDLSFARAARQAIGDYEVRTEELHRRLGGLIYDTQAQTAQPDWNEYVLRLDTLATGAHAGSPRGALILGLIESANGRHTEAFRHMLIAVVDGDAGKEARDEIGRLLQKLIDAGDRKSLASILNDVEQMAGRQSPGWQIWAARINDVLGEHDKAASWYRQVTENKDAGSAEIDFAQSEMARLMSRG